MSPVAVTLRAHAKINLSLRVLGRRPDGYHGLRTVFQSLALHDTLRVEAVDEPLLVRCNDPAIPVDDRNLVWRAARLVWASAGRDGEPRGRVRLTKRIPAEGGLGGGSADGAAALVAWDAVWAVGVGAPRLFELAAQLGADVPFFLRGGTAVGLNRGDVIHALPDLPSRWVVLVCPSFGVSTPAAYRWLDEDRAGDETLPGVDGGSSDDEGTLGLRATPAESPGGRAPSPWPAGLPAIANDLEPSVARRHPEIAEVRRSFDRAGAEAAAMTGSGSTVFGLFLARAAAEAAAVALAGRGWRVIVSRTAARRRAALLPSPS